MRYSKAGMWRTTESLTPFNAMRKLAQRGVCVFVCACCVHLDFPVYWHREAGRDSFLPVCPKKGGLIILF